MTTAPPSRLRIVLEWITGILLVVLGIIGILLPVMQGLIFLIPGLAVLSRHSELARRLRNKLEGMGRGIKDRVRRRRNRSSAAGTPPPPSPPE